MSHAYVKKTEQMTPLLAGLRVEFQIFKLQPKVLAHKGESAGEKSKDTRGSSMTETFKVDGFIEQVSM